MRAHPPNDLDLQAEDYPMCAHPADDPDLLAEDYPMRTHAVCQKFLLLCLLGKATRGVEWLADTFNKTYYRPGRLSRLWSENQSMVPKALVIMIKQ
jgi:hypothetical protein